MGMPAVFGFSFVVSFVRVNCTAAPPAVVPLPISANCSRYLKILFDAQEQAHYIAYNL
jgi:hypothetical protein